MKDDDAEDEGSVSVTKYAVLPSLVSLQQMRNRLKMAKEGHRLMKWSAVATGQEMRRLAELIYKAMDMFAEEVKNCFILLARCRFYYPTIDTMVLEGPGTEACATIAYSMKTSAGVKIQLYNVIESDKDPYPHLGIGKGGITILEAKKAWRNLLKNLIKVMEYRMMFIAFEISHKNATKKSNVLGKIIMPKTDLTIAYILSELEEMAREEFFRLKKVLQVKKKLKMAKEGKLLKKAKEPNEPIPPMEMIPEEVKQEEKPAPCCECHLKQGLDKLLRQTQLYKEKGEIGDIKAIQESSRTLREKLDSAAVCYYGDTSPKEKKLALIDGKKGDESSSTYSNLVQTLHNAASFLSIPHLCRFCKEQSIEPASSNLSNKPILARRGVEDTKATNLISGGKVQKAVSYADVCERCKANGIKPASNSDKSGPDERNPVTSSVDCKCSPEKELKTDSNSGIFCQRCQGDDQISDSSKYCSCSTVSTRDSYKSIFSTSKRREENQPGSLDKTHKQTQTPRHSQHHLQSKPPSHTSPTLRNLSKESPKDVKSSDEQSIFSSIVEKIQKAVSYLNIPPVGQTEARMQSPQSTSASNQLKVKSVDSKKSIQSKKTDDSKSNDSITDILGEIESDQKKVVKILRIKNNDGSITEKITIIRIVKDKKNDGSDSENESQNHTSTSSSKAHSDKRTVGIVSVTFPKNLNYEALERQGQSTHGSRAFPMANPLNRHCLSLISLATVDYEFQSVCVSLMSTHQEDYEITSMSNDLKSCAELSQLMNSYESTDITPISQTLQVNESNSDLTSSINTMVQEDFEDDKQEPPKDFTSILTSVTDGPFQEKESNSEI